jgi:DNA (cytosine-5)-methyltransferase 1
MENVDALVSKKYIDSFNDWIDRLNIIGYNSYYQTINAKNTGIPQNRNRIFVISILKDIDTKKFEFPKPFDSGIRLKDVLEDDDEVLDKYFLSDEIQKRLRITDDKFAKNVIGTTLGEENHRIGTRDIVYRKDGIIGCLTATDYKQPHQILENPNEINKIETVSANEPIHSADLCSEKYSKMHDISRRVYSEDGIAPTMHTCGGGNQETKVDRDKLRIVRKLTPKEAHRLMGFDDIDYENCKAVGMSDTQGYKQSGNSIVTTCISLLTEHLYKAQYDNNYVCYDEKMQNFYQPQAE